MVLMKPELIPEMHSFRTSGAAQFDWHIFGRWDETSKIISIYLLLSR